jgi:hypothetical protein
MHTQASISPETGNIEVELLHYKSIYATLSYYLLHAPLNLAYTRDREHSGSSLFHPKWWGPPVT